VGKQQISIPLLHSREKEH